MIAIRRVRRVTRRLGVRLSTGLGARLHARRSEREQRFARHDTSPRLQQDASPRLRREAGFTLIELLVVIVILGMLAAVAGPQAIKLLGGAKTDTAKIQIRELGTILDVYRLDTGAYPTTNQGLQALSARPPGLKRWNGPYVKHRDQIADPWGNPFQYRNPGQHGEYDIWSTGDGSEGDTQTATLNNW